jgi:hypothetical protein
VVVGAVVVVVVVGTVVVVVDVVAVVLGAAVVEVGTAEFEQAETSTATTIGARRRMPATVIRLVR